MISHASSSGVHTLIGSNQVTWSWPDGFKVQASSASLGSEMPHAPGMYVLCKFDGTSIQAMYIGTAANLHGKLNVDLTWHPKIAQLISLGVHFVAFVATKELSDCISLRNDLMERFDLPFGSEASWHKSHRAL